MSEKVGDLYYEVSADTAKLLTGSIQATKILDGLDKSSSKTDKSFTRLTKTSASVSAALAMPEVDRLTKQMAELAGKIGVSSETMKSNTVAAKQQGQALSTVSQLLGTSYVGSVGRSTSALLQHTVAAVSSADANRQVAESALQEAKAIQAASAELVKKAEAERSSAAAAVKAAEDALEAESQYADAVYGSEQAVLNKLKAQLAEAEEFKRSSAISEARNDVIKQQNKLNALAAKNNETITQAEKRLSAAKQAESLATQQLSHATATEIAAKQTLVAANNNLATAQVKVTTAAKAQAAAIAGLRSVYALLGGPSGILLLAAAGVYSLYKALSDNGSIDEHINKVDQAISKLEELTTAQAEAARVANRKILEQRNKELAETRKEIDELQKVVDSVSFKNAEESGGGAAKLAKEYSDQLKDLTGRESDLVIEIERRSKAESDLQKQSEAVLGKDHQLILANSTFSKSTQQLTTDIDSQTIALENGSYAAEMFNGVQKIRNDLISAGITDQEIINEKVAEFQSLLEEKQKGGLEADLKTLQQNTEALRKEMEEGTLAAIKYRAELYATDKGYDEAGAKAYVEAVLKQHEAQTKLNESKKSGSAVAKAYNSTIKQLADQLVVAEHALTATNREQAIFEAQMRLGANATKAQKDAAAELAGQLYDLKQRQDDINNAKQADPTNAYKEGTAQLKRQLDNNLITQEQYNQRSQKLGVEHQKALAQIRAQEAVTPQQELAGMVDPVQALANENAQKLALIKQFEEDKTITEQRGTELRNAANKEYEQQRRDAMWELWRQQSILNETLAAAFDSVGSSASNALTGMLSGTKTVNEALLSVANTILNSVINSFVQMGIEQAKAAIMGATVQKSAIASTTIAQSAALVKTTAANTAAATSSTTAWTPAAIVASIGSFGGAAAIGLGAVVAALAGKRKNGGPVSAGSMYQVGEGGLPEIFQANNGRQYMIPGDNGSVISNKDIGSGGGVGVTVYNNIQNYTSSIVDSQVTSNSDGSVTIQTVVADLNQGGPISQAISYNHNAPRRATA